MTVRMVLCFVALSLVVVACYRDASYGYTRGSDDPTVDDPALSMGLDRRDIEDVLNQNLGELMNSRFMAAHSPDKGMPSTIAILPFVNTTMKDIDGPLDAMLSQIETRFVNDGRLDVVSLSRRDELREERLEQQDFVIFDASRAAKMGRELGAHFVITGEIYEVDEVVADMERVQYFLKLQVINVENAKIEWQGNGEVTKSLEPVAMR